MKFLTLGPLSVIGSGRDITPTASKPREVLALLLLRNNQVVQTWEFIDELWGDYPPASALSTLQTYIYKLRKMLSEDPLAASGELLVTRPQGYMLTISPDDLDLHQFELLTDNGSAALAGDDPETAADHLAKALDLWRGPPLGDVCKGNLLSAYVTSLEESKVWAHELRIEADLQLGRHRDVIGELKELTSTKRFHEGFHEKLMLALYRSGRRSEAMEVYRSLRTVLIRELGVEPSTRTQRLHQALLTSDPVLDLRPRSVAALSGHRTAIVPAQLPPGAADFVGRAGDLAKVISRLSAAAETPTVAPIVSIAGMAGVGKTTLAITAAHLVRREFPDGQLFANLRGSSGSPANPADVLYDFLWAVGIPSESISASLEERAKMFRTWCDGRRVLIVLDDAETACQVEPLLPAYGRCGALVTSRSGLQGLYAAEHLELDILTFAEGIELLSKIIRRNLAETEGTAAEEIVRLCGRLPLAIRTAGARVRATRGLPLSGFARRLARSRERLDELCFGDLDVRAKIAESYLRLGEKERRVMRLLSLLENASFSARGAAKLIGYDTESIEAQIARLVESHFLRIVPNDLSGETLYTFHDLTRLYARERLEQQLVDIGSELSIPYLESKGLGDIEQDSGTVRPIPADDAAPGGRETGGPDRAAGAELPVEGTPWVG